MSATTPENAVKRRIRKVLKDYKVYCFAAAAGPFSVHGVPDIICCVNGKFVAIEVKAPGKVKSVTKNQRYHLATIKENGGYAIVTDNEQDVIALMEEIMS